MTEIVIRHAETKDYDAIRQIHAQPEVYHNTLQVPHPSSEMWQARLAEQDLPAPFSPRIASTSPGHTSRQMSSLATMPGYAFVM